MRLISVGENRNPIYYDTKDYETGSATDLREADRGNTVLRQRLMPLRVVSRIRSPSCSNCLRLCLYFFFLAIAVMLIRNSHVDGSSENRRIGVTIQGNSTGAYLCFNRRGKLTTRVCVTADLLYCCLLCYMTALLSSHCRHCLPYLSLSPPHIAKHKPLCEHREQCTSCRHSSS